MSKQRIIPHSQEAESAVLGAMFQNEKARLVCIEQLEAQDFYIPANREIFQAMQDLLNHGKPIDEITTIAYLQQKDLLKKAGGVAYISELQGLLPALTNLMHYVRIIKDNAMRRKLIALSSEIADMSFEVNDTSDVINFVETELFSISKQEQIKTFDPIEKLVADYYFALQNDIELGVPSGFPTLDKVLKGLRKGSLYILAARPSVGKSALASNIAINTAQKGNTVAFFSLEMPSHEIVSRMLCDVGKINANTLSNKKGKDWNSLVVHTQDLGEMPIFINDTPNLNMTQIRSLLLRLKARNKKLDLVVIDYLQIMNHGAGKNRNKNDEIAETTRMLKSLAKELEVPILLLSQLNRASEIQKRAPMLSDLRDSGAIEQDADVVMFINREKEKIEEPAELIVAKNRQGRICTLPFYFRGQYCQFTESSYRS